MVMLVAGGLLLAILVLAPGYAAWRAFRSPVARRPDAASGIIAAISALEAAAIVTASGILVTGWLALVLASFGLLRLPLLSLLVALLTAALLIFARRRGHALRPRPPRLSGADWAGLAVGLVTLVLVLRPHQIVVGGLDAGVYVNTGATIARTGRLQIHDPLTASLATTAARQRPQTDTPDIAPPSAEGAIRHLMGRLPEGRFPFSDYLRLNGFYVSDLASGLLTPQFFHLYPTWLGLFGLAVGDTGMLYATPIFGWLGAVMMALAGRRLFGAWVGNATLLILGLNSLQIWFARHSLSEAFLQFLLCTAVYGWVAAHPGTPERDVETPLDQRTASPTPDPFFLALAGMALGSFALAHAQFVFAFGLLPLLAVWLWLSRRWRPAYWAFFGPIIFLLDHAILYILTIALEYFEGLYHHVILDLWHDRVFFLVLLHTAALVLVLLNWQRHRWWPLLTQPRLRQLGLAALASGAALVLAYAYLIRPGLLAPGILTADLTKPGLLAGYIGAPVPAGPQANLVRLGWYLSPLGILLAAIGTVAILARMHPRLLLLLGLAGVYGLAFNLASFTHESYIYSLRRFVPIVLPALSLAAAYAAVRVIPAILTIGCPSKPRHWLARAAGAGTLAALTLFFAFTGRTIISHVEYEGAPAQIAAIAAEFSPTDLIIFSGPRDEPHKLATPLRFFHGLDTLVVSTNNPRGDVIDAWLSHQRDRGRRIRVVLGNNGGKLLLPGYQLEPVKTLTLTLRELESLSNQKPFNVQTNTLTYTIYDVRVADGAPLGTLPFRYQTGPGDELATVIGWYGREVADDGTLFRWTNGDALLRLPWPAPRGPLRLRLHLAGGVRPATLGPARVDVGLARGQNDWGAAGLATLTLSEDFATYEITIPPGALPDQPTGTVMLALYNHPLMSPAWKPIETGISSDPRLLGVRLAWLELVEE